jgi:hypothetical protein
MSNVIFDVPADSIDALPTDQTPPSHSEIQIIDTLFKQKQGTVQKLLSGTQDVLIVGFLFVLFSLPQVDVFIMKAVPSTTTSPYILVFVKTLIFMSLFFIFKNMHLVRNK